MSNESAYFFHGVIIGIIFIVSLFVSCLYAQGVYLERDIAKKVITELLEFDGLKQEYSLLDDTFESFKKQNQSLIENYKQSQSEIRDIQQDFDRFKERQKKKHRHNQVKYVGAVLGGIVGALNGINQLDANSKPIPIDPIKQFGKGLVGAGIGYGLGFTINLVFL